MGMDFYFSLPQNARFFAFLPQNVRFKKSVKYRLLRVLTLKSNLRLLWRVVAILLFSVPR
jgi:hypothetical protein